MSSQWKFMYFIKPQPNVVLISVILSLKAMKHISAKTQESADVILLSLWSCVFLI